MFVLSDSNIKTQVSTWSVHHDSQSRLDIDAACSAPTDGCAFEGYCSTPVPGSVVGHQSNPQAEYVDWLIFQADPIDFL